MNKNFSEESLVSFKDNKSPGPDGLTKEFYAFFWEDIKKPYFFKKGERICIKNYRPLTLLNLDLK